MGGALMSRCLDGCGGGGDDIQRRRKLSDAETANGDTENNDFNRASESEDGACCGVLRRRKIDSSSKPGRIEYSERKDSVSTSQRLLEHDLPSDLLQLHFNAKTTFNAAYKLGNKLGGGDRTTVFCAIHQQTGEEVAVKRTQRSDLDQSELEWTLREVKMLRELQNRYILEYRDFYRDRDYYYLITEEIKGSPILEELSVKESYTEEEVRRWIRQLLQALEHAHHLRIVHRDVRLENIMLTSHDVEFACIKLLDWGYARVVSNDKQLHKQLGDPGYMAPEVIIGGPYGRPADIWSCGVVTYFLLAGYPPFHHDNNTDESALFRTIASGYYVFDSPYWDDISDAAKDCIRSMLIVDPLKRKTAAQLLEHRWFGRESSLDSPQLHRTLENIRQNRGMTPRWKAAYNVAVAGQWLKGFLAAKSPHPNLRPEGEEQLKLSSPVKPSPLTKIVIQPLESVEFDDEEDTSI